MTNWYGAEKKRAASNNRSVEGEVRRILKQAIADDMQAKREAFLVLSTQLWRETQGIVKTPSKILIREDRDQGH